MGCTFSVARIFNFLAFEVLKLYVKLRSIKTYCLVSLEVKKDSRRKEKEVMSDYIGMTVLWFLQNGRTEKLATRMINLHILYLFVYFCLVHMYRLGMKCCQ